MEKRIREVFEQSIQLKTAFLEESVGVLESVVEAVARTMRSGGKVLVFGNGGSAADAQHIAAEFVNRYLIERAPLPAIALTADSSVLTSIANDYSYEDVFEKQVKALGRAGDLALGISTSGRSANVNRALKAAREAGLTTVGFGGAAGSPMAEYCDVFVPVTGGPTPRIQEVHQTVVHLVVELVDEMLFSAPGEDRAGEARCS